MPDTINQEDLTAEDAEGRRGTRLEKNTKYINVLQAYLVQLNALRISASSASSAVNPSSSMAKRARGPAPAMQLLKPTAHAALPTVMLGLSEVAALRVLPVNPGRP